MQESNLIPHLELCPSLQMFQEHFHDCVPSQFLAMDKMPESEYFIERVTNLDIYNNFGLID